MREKIQFNSKSIKIIQNEKVAAVSNRRYFNSAVNANKNDHNVMEKYDENGIIFELH